MISRKAVAVAIICVLGPSCCPSESSKPVVPDVRTVLTLPSKDDVALIDGRPLTLTVFSGLKKQFPSVSNETVLWVGLSAIAVQNRARVRGLELSATSALNIARYAAGEADLTQVKPDLEQFYQGLSIPRQAEGVRLDIEHLLRQATILRNPETLKEFRDNDGA